jgi:hypothetical protein
VDDAVETCPLCASPIQRLGAAPRGEAAGPYPQRIIDPEDAYKLSKAERRHIGVEILSLAAFLVIGALFLVDFLLDSGLGWSRYAVASVALAWIASAMPLILHGRTKATLALLCAAILGFLLVIDGLDGELGWSLSLGIPIALTTFLAAAATAVVMAKRRVKGLNLLGIGALSLAAYLIALESILRLGLGSSDRPYWSFIAAIALVPLAIFLFYLHMRVLRGANLRKIFRL